MTNTINNVPRELLENIVLCYNEGEFELGTLAAECHALLSAPSPAGVDGLEVVADVCGDGLGFLVGVLRSGHLFSAGESLCRLCDAQAIIDGLRVELAVALKVPSVAAMHTYLDTECAKDNISLGAERDQQAQRIGELEGLLRDFAYHTQRREMPTESSLAAWADRIEAALSAGKEGE